MPVQIHDRPVRYSQLEITLEPAGDTTFHSNARSTLLSIAPAEHMHRMYVQPDDLRVALSAVTERA